ncbi:MAG: efflux RND transporter permease subunit [Saprospiraceae bacterium]|nr:efflux RND transporter permease subunit [Saprospiraceae bacterium]
MRYCSQRKWKHSTRSGAWGWIWIFFRFEIASKIRQLYKSFPQGVSFPIIRVNDPEQEVAERPILTYAITGNANSSTLYKYGKEVLSPQLALVDGLERIEIAGGDFFEFRIIYQSAKTALLGIDENDILAAIASTFSIQGLGVVRDGDSQFSIRLNNTLHQSDGTPSQTIQQLSNIPVTKSNKKIIYLKVYSKHSLQRNTIHRILQN